MGKSPLTFWGWFYLSIGLYYCILAPLTHYTYGEVRLWWATPTPTPVALPLDLEPTAEETARDAVYAWLREQYALQSLPDSELETRAYYLAGEAPRFRAATGYLDCDGWPVWPGYRYVVGSADGRWTIYWSGCQELSPQHVDGTLWYCNLMCDAIAIHPFPELAAAQQVGAAVATRAGQQIVAVVWDWSGACPTSAPPEHLPPSGPGH